MKTSKKVLGIGIGKNSGKGKAVRVDSFYELARVKKGDILVTKAATPDFVVILDKVACLITDQGGLTSHVAIVCREMGSSAILGTENTTEIFLEGQEISFDCRKGEAKTT